jgi:hypothetical protein
MILSPLAATRLPVAAIVMAGTLAFLGQVAAKEPTQPTQSLETETFKPESGQAGKDVIWVPTPDEIVNAMLDMAKLKAGETHFDLGSGDGKIVIAGAKRGANSTGVEFNPDMVGLSQRNAARAGVSDRARFVQGDIFQTDFSRADVITLYLLPTLNLRLRPQILDMKPGTRVSSHQFTMGDWEPDQRVTLSGRDALSWVVPAKIGGGWDATIEGSGGALKLNLTQKYQKVEGTATWGGAAAKLDQVQVDGANVRFTVTDAKGAAHRFAATAGHDGKMSGTLTDGSGTRKFSAVRTTAASNGNGTGTKL